MKTTKEQGEPFRLTRREKADLEAAALLPSYRDALIALQNAYVRIAVRRIAGDLRTVARGVGTSYSTFKRLARRAGVRPRTKTGQHPTQGRISLDTEE